MKRLNFTIAEPLHKQLTTICSQLNYDTRPLFYAECLKKGAEILEADAKVSQHFDFVKTIAYKIYEKVDKVEGSHPFTLDFNHGKYNIYCSGSLHLEYKQTHPETLDAESESVCSYVDLELDILSPSIAVDGDEIAHSVDFVEIEKELNNLLK